MGLCMVLFPRVLEYSPTQEYLAMKAKLLLSISAIACLAALARADKWPTWRGPDGQGHSAEKGLPTRWSTSENVRWKVALADDGNSTPIVWGDRVFITQATQKGK